MAEVNDQRPQRPRRVSPAALRQLRQPLDQALVSERTADDGQVLQYLEGWRVIAQANAIFGHGRWGAELVGEVVHRPIIANWRARNGPSVGIYTATVRVSVDGCPPHSDVGVATITDQTAEAHANAYKAAVTDALKRAFRHFGDQFGNRLSAGSDESQPLAADDSPEELRCKVLEISARAGSDEARTRDWVAQRYGQPLDELDARPLLDAIGTLNRGLDRRNGHASTG
jgi:DNA recombination protein Rad52